jgi:hypothetical protein
VRRSHVALGAFVFAFATLASNAAHAADPDDKTEGKGDKTDDKSETSGDEKTEKPEGTSAEGEAKPEAEASASASKKDEWDITDVAEKEHQKYYFVGLRYRGNVIPQFMESLFVDEGGTVYSNSIGIELDMRKDGFSLIPALVYQDYNTGDFLFHEKGKPLSDNNYTVVNSSLKAVYLMLDILWSAPLAKDVDFEYGLGVGVGAVFGNLTNDWVFQDANGKYVASTGTHYSDCRGVTTNKNGCDPTAHTDPTPHKVGGFVEQNWFSGGSVPTIFPWISIPQLGIRFKPIKQVESRLGVGFSLTGFWFGLSADYGLEKRPERKTAASSQPSFRWGGAN